MLFGISNFVPLLRLEPQSRITKMPTASSNTYPLKHASSKDNISATRQAMSSRMGQSRNPLFSTVLEQTKRFGDLFSILWPIGDEALIQLTEKKTASRVSREVQQLGSFRPYNQAKEVNGREVLTPLQPGANTDTSNCVNYELWTLISFSGAFEVRVQQGRRIEKQVVEKLHGWLGMVQIAMSIRRRSPARAFCI